MVKTQRDKKLDNQSIINPETDVGHARCIKRYQPFRYADYEGMRAPKINQTPDHPVRRWLKVILVCIHMSRLKPRLRSGSL